MIIWKGWGILVVLIAVPLAALSSVIAGSIGESVVGPQNADLIAPLGGAVGLAIAAIIVFVLGRWMNAPVPGYDPQTGQPVYFKNRHSLFFIPMQWWSFLLLGVALIFVFGPLTEL
ncbi:hypothetical protein J4H86_09440 [Spiractinospora alimapuensis]|uniref:hypothetical protein n=1 Tax=Spiractinospora alimapuensis TaxID=2820884 RepID=UPI001F379CC4|nr:hypothetical protein [Spiractinospora alimapuensis]QVQ53906.1 hypothetical protein J4H86_09440 [Spiractinospora alimapuensis]